MGEASSAPTSCGGWALVRLQSCDSRLSVLLLLVNPDRTLTRAPTPPEAGGRPAGGTGSSTLIRTDRGEDDHAGAHSCRAIDMPGAYCYRRSGQGEPNRPLCATSRSTGYQATELLSKIERWSFLTLNSVMSATPWTCNGIVIIEELLWSDFNDFKKLLNLKASFFYDAL